MNKVQRWLAGCGVCLVAAVMVIWHERKDEPRSALLTHEGYLWQRAWTPAVKSALQRETTGLDALYIQAGEISGKGGRIIVARATVDWSLLAGLHRPVGIAWRVGSEVMALGADDTTFAAIEQQWAITFKAATAAGLPIAEAQWDCDCPQRQLPKFAAWVRQMKQRHPGLRWTFTALPAWQSSRAFGELARAADGFVLQVHWLRPASNGSPVLMVTDEALHAADQAAQWRVPFKVALPTYGSAVICDAQKQWLDVVSEDAIQMPPGTHLKEVAASPADARFLLQRWQQQRPSGLTGIVWYRLPVEGDKRNWSWPQLQAVMQGRTPAPRWEASLIPQPEGYENVVIRNTGDGDAMMPAIISLQTDNVLAFDSTIGYNGKEVGHGLIFSAANPKPLAAGGHASIGWVRRENLKGVFRFQFGL